MQPDLATLEIHPFAKLFPRPSDEEFKELEDDCVKNGFQAPLFTYNGKLIDGCTRREVWLLHPSLSYTIVDCGYETDDEALAFVISLNLRRRHLSQSQRAALLVELYDKFGAVFREPPTDEESEAVGDVEEESPPTAPEPTRTVERIAEKVKVNKTYVQKAKKLKKENPDLLSKVASGEVSSITKAAEMHAQEQKKELATEDEPRDAVGVPIPAKLIPVFDTPKTFRVLMKTLSKVRSELESLSAAPGGGYISIATVNRDIENLRTHLKSAIPFALCPGCSGKGCGACKMYGYIHEKGYELLIKEATAGVA